MNPKKVVIHLFFLLVCSLTQAQEKFVISGKITDYNNGETLLGASVYLEGTKLGTSTNEYGFYSLTAPKGTYKMVVSYLGFEDVTKQINLDANLRLDFKLKEQSNMLEEVVLSSKKTNLRKPQMSVSKLSSATIKQIPSVAGEVDIIKSIQMLPGVSNSGEASSGFNVRGGAEDQNLILFDEAIIYNSSHLFGFFSVFNNDAVKNIKLYKGGIPSKFGGRISSVLDIRQKDGNKKEYKVTGGVGLISSRLTLEGPIVKDKSSFLLAGRTAYFNLFLSLMKNEYRFGFYDFNLKTDYQINKNNSLYFSSYYGNDDVNFFDTFINSYGNISANLRWNHIFDDTIFSNLSFIFSKYDYRFELDFVGFEWKSDIKNYQLKYDVNYFMNDKMKFDVGLSLINYKFNPGILNPLKSNSINHTELDKKYAIETGFYAGLEHKISSKFTAKYGFRISTFSRIGLQEINLYKDDKPLVFNDNLKIYERAKPIAKKNYKNNELMHFYANFEPRLAFSYQLNELSSVKASYNRMVQYIHLVSNTASAVPLDVWAPSGKYIKPQLADQYAIGYFKNFKNNMYSLELESYYKTVANRLDYIDGARLIGQNVLEREILSGEAKSYGLELLFRKNTGNFTGWVAYTLSKSQQRALGGIYSGTGINEGQWYNTVYDKTHDFSFTGNYKLNEKWSFSANFVYQTGRPVTYPNGQFEYIGTSFPTYNTRNGNRLPDFHRLDISATLTPRKNKHRKWKSEWIFGIYNVYNRKNPASITFSQNWEKGRNEAVQMSILPIIPSVSYNFKF